MEVIRQLLARVRTWEYTFLCVLLITNLAMHFSIINNPDTRVLDEFYYVDDAKLILEQHTDNRTEHPPLGKLLVASNIALLGDNPYGWRTFPILFGTANIALLYLICRRLGLARKAANIAAFLMTFENLSFVQGQIAMLDVFSLTFMLLSFWLYLRKNYPLSAVAVALATLSKLTGVFAIVVIGLHWLIARRDRKLNFIASMCLAPLSFLLLMPLFEFLIYRRLVNFLAVINYMFVISGGVKYANVVHPYKIRPWELLVNPGLMLYNHEPTYIAGISFTLWALIIPVTVYLVIIAVRKNDGGIFGASWFTGTFLIWFPIVLLTDRVIYVYYFYPAIGAICLALGMGLAQLIDFWKTKRTGGLRWLAISGVALFLALHLATFVFLSPFNSYLVWKILF